MSARRGGGAHSRWGSSSTPCQLSFLESVPWTAAAGNVLESLVSQERELGEVETHTDRKRQTDKAGHGRGGKKEGERNMENDGERRRREGEVSKLAASQPIKSLEWEEGARDSRLSSGPVMAQCRVMGTGGGEGWLLPGAEMSGVAWGRLVWRKEARGRGKREGGREKTPLGDITQGNEAKEHFQCCSRDKRKEALRY